MKYLKIETNKGYYLDVNGDSKEIDQINKDDLLNLLTKTIEDSTFEMDEYDESQLANKAHQIIYKNIHEKLKNILDNKTRFSDEAKQMYKSAFEKYGMEEE